MITMSAGRGSGRRISKPSGSTGWRRPEGGKRIRICEITERTPERLGELLAVPGWLWAWLAGIAAMKAGNLLWGLRHGRSFAVAHTAWNRLTELALFPLPRRSAVPVCLLATAAAIRPRQVSRVVEAGGVAAAVESASGKVYVGVCVDTACSLGVCAERNAIFHMMTCGEDAIRRVLAVDGGGKVMPPCGACRELMAQLMPETYGQVEVLMDYETGRGATLGELTPEWWL